MAALQERLHNAIYAGVERAAAPVAHLEASWPSHEITKRICKHMLRAAVDEELPPMEWNKLTRELVQRSMRGYSHSCNESEWYYEIDLVPVLTTTALDILATAKRISVHPQAVEDIVRVEYDDTVERCMLEKTMWDAAAAMFTDDKVRSKVWKCLSAAYWPALDEALASSMSRAHLQRPPQEDLRHVEEFMRAWIHDSMGRAWSALPSMNADGDSVLTEDLMCKLFQRLLVPLGEEHPFSCVSSDLTSRIGRPPHDWKFIRQAVRELASGQAHGGGRKRKSNNQGGGGDWQGGKRKNIGRPKKEAEADGEGVQAEQAQGNPDKHPRCTSEEDCLGSSADQLVRHNLNGQPADVYCITCWESFLQRNPSLEGDIVEDESLLDS